MKSKKALFSAAIILAVLFFIPFSLSGSLKKDISLSLKDKQVRELSPSGLSLVFLVAIANSSDRSYSLTHYSYRFVVSQKEYLRLNAPLEGGIVIEPSKTTLIALPVKVTYALLFQAIPEIEAADKAVCYLTGELAFSERERARGSLPFSFTGEFPVFKKPRVEFRGLKVKALTVGGADLNFEVKFLNENGFELLVDRIGYNLESGGYQIGGGEISGDKNIPAHGEKTFSLPLLLNFFEVGKEVYAILKQPSVSLRFSGSVEIRTIWGKIAIPFDESGNAETVPSSAAR